jgi:hypothetical protein
MLEELQKIKTPYLSTDILLELFKGHKRPRDKISNLVKQEQLVHITQGLYTLGKVYERPYSREVFSTIIYGPSAISFEYALSYLGLIPERVETLTCLVFKKNKEYQTGIGTFTYKYISPNKFSVGLNYWQTDLGNFFMASAEKALCDMVYAKKLKNTDEILEYLMEDLRIDSVDILKLDIYLLTEIAVVYSKKSVTLLKDAITLYQNKFRTNDHA